MAEKNKTYTLDELRDLWDRYSTDRVMRLYQDGEWKTVQPESIKGTLINATKAQHVPARTAISFPDYLEGLQ